MVPEVQEILDDLQDLFSPDVRVVIESFARDKYRSTSEDGRRCLTTMVVHMPDNKTAEELHLAMRRAQRAMGRQVISNTTRMRACMDSGVIEGRDVLHRKVSRNRFCRWWGKRNTVRIGWRFNAVRHDISPRWLDMTGKRDWTSYTPEAARVGLMAWSWAKRYFTLANRPPFKDARMSLLLPRQWFVSGPAGEFGLCLGQSKWGGILLSCSRIRGLPDNTSVYTIGHDIEIVHVTRPMQWRAYKYTALPPLQLHKDYPGHGSFKVTFKASG